MSTQKPEKQLKTNDESRALIKGVLEIHHLFTETTSKHYRPFLVETVRQIEKEYDCTTPTERMLAELAGGAYIRIITHSKPVNLSTEEDILSHYKNGYYSMQSKELDRAHRQFITAIATLKQIKSPLVEFNITARTAFVAQNQQINAVNNPAKQDENINPK